MNWSNIRDTVARVAPIAGGLLGGPAGGAVGTLIADALGVSADPGAVAAALADPASVERLRQMEAKHRETLEAMRLEEIRAHLADMANARARDVAVRQAGGQNVRANILATVAVCGLVAAVILLFTSEVPDGAREPLLLVLGSLTGLVSQVFNFEFGSSMGSKTKTQIIGGARNVG